MNTIEAGKIRSLQYLFNSIVAEKTRENLPKYAILAGAGCSISSGVASGGRIIDIIEKYAYLIQSNDSDAELLAKWNHQSATLERFISSVEKLLDKDKLQEFIFNREKEFQAQQEDPKSKLRIIGTLPRNLKCQYPDVFSEDGKVKEDAPIVAINSIWEKYSAYFQKERQYGFWMYEYSPVSSDIQTLIESFIEYKNPSAEYYLLADLVAKGVINNIFTTNFDDFFQEALSFLGLRARVCSFEDKADVINFDRGKPNIIKLHGDYLYSNTRNYNNETAELHESLRAKFQEALGKFGLIVIGYAGNDYSIMSVLEELKDINFPLYWCILDSDLQNGNIPWRVRELISSTNNSYFVPISGFREFVELLWRQWYRIEELGANNPGSSIIRAFDKATELSAQIKSILNSGNAKSQLSDGIPIDTIEFDFSRLKNAPVISPFSTYDSEIPHIQQSRSTYLQDAVTYYNNLQPKDKEIARQIIKLVGDFVFLTSHLLTFLLCKDNPTLGQAKIYSVLRKLTSVNILSQIKFKTPTLESYFSVFSLDFNGDKLYLKFFKTKPQWDSTLKLTLAPIIKKYLVAAQSIASIRKYIGNISYQITPKFGSSSGGVRPTAVFRYSKNNVVHEYLLEAVRRTPDWDNDLLEKLGRYNTCLLEKYHHRTLILCGEDREHTKQTFQIVESWRETAYEKMRSNQLDECSIWFTEDIAFLSEKLTNTFTYLYRSEQDILAVPIEISHFFNIIEADDENGKQIDIIDSQLDENVPQYDYIEKETVDGIPEDEQHKVRHEIVIACLSLGKIGQPIRLEKFAQQLQRQNFNYREYGFSKLIQLLRTQSAYLSIEDNSGVNKCVRLLESQLTNEEVSLANQFVIKPIESKDDLT